MLRHLRERNMGAPSQKQITQMLVDWGNGDEAALEKLTPLVYDQLHRLARRYMVRERPGHTLQASALVNEAISVTPPDNPDVIYVGTGEGGARNSISFGDGIYKSTDGGKTSRHLGLKDSERFARIVIHPANPQIVIAAAMGHRLGRRPAQSRSAEPARQIELAGDSSRRVQRAAHECAA